MGTILEHLQTQRDNADVTLVTYAADITLVLMDLTDSIVPPTTSSQHLAHAGPSRLIAAYPLGMPHNYNPHFANGNPFMPYQPFGVAPSIVNPPSFPWGIHNSYSAQGVKTEETPADIAEAHEPKYMCSPLNFHIFSPSAHPNPYAFAVMIPPFLNNTVL